MSYKVLIIGGGPSGLMAAIAAASQCKPVLLIDKGDKLGRKLGISGGGRCNVTNNKDMDELIRNIPGNGRFLYSALASFNNRSIIDFFEKLGIRLKEEDNGRMFPVSDKAKTVVDTLVNEVRRLGVEIRTNEPVAEINYVDGEVSGLTLRSGERIAADSIIIASGGKSVPHTGSTGDGYAWAEAAGHTITSLFPTEVPLTSSEPFIRSRELQGLSLRDVSLTIWNAKGKPAITHTGDMLFTHFGLSGPIALRCSQFVVKELLKQQQHGQTAEVKATIDLFPSETAPELIARTMSLCASEPKKAIKNVLKAVLPDKLIPRLLQAASLGEHVTYDNIPKANWAELWQYAKQMPVLVDGTLSIEEAFVTGGGINLKEVDPRTMGSKLVRGLYFCGEILDIHGYTGGYNITAAFSTGHCAGTNAGISANQR